MHQHQPGPASLLAPPPEGTRPGPLHRSRRAPGSTRGRAAGLVGVVVALLMGAPFTSAAPASAGGSAATGAPEVAAPVPELLPAPLARLVRLPAEAPFPGRLLGRGLVGDDVRQVQAYLNTQGATLEVDGIFGPATAGAVRRFQRTAGVATDGIVGPVTWSRGPSGATASAGAPVTPAAPAPAAPAEVLAPPAPSPPALPAAPVTTAPAAAVTPVTPPAPVTPVTPVTPAAPSDPVPTAAPVTTLASVPTAGASVPPVTVGAPSARSIPVPGDPAEADDGPAGADPNLTGRLEAEYAAARAEAEKKRENRSATGIVIAATLALIAALLAVAVVGRRRDARLTAPPPEPATRASTGRARPVTREAAIPAKPRPRP